MLEDDQIDPSGFTLVDIVIMGSLRQDSRTPRNLSMDTMHIFGGRLLGSGLQSYPIPGISNRLVVAGVHTTEKICLILGFSTISVEPATPEVLKLVPQNWLLKNSKQ